MSTLRPFRALRPHPANAALVAAVPYDVVNRQEAKALAAGNPLSFLHVSRPEIDLPDSIPYNSEQAYELAGAQFRKLMEQCPFIQDEEPSLYLYGLRLGDHEQTGVVGTFSLEEYANGIIKRHERTRADKEDDRTRHTIQLGAQTGPVYLAYRDVVEINQEMLEVRKTQPLYQFQASDGVYHTLWRVTQTEKWVRFFDQSVPALYIADGHHRAAAASRVSVQSHSSHRAHAYHYMLAVAFPASQLKIYPYHRVVKDLGAYSPSEFLEKLAAHFEVSTGDASIPASKEIGMYLDGRWYRLRPRPGVASELDVDLLQEFVLQPLLGIQDARTDRRIDFVGGIRGTAELERWVNQGDAKVAFSLHPTDLSQVMAVSDRGDIMPPKSTWFEPKLRDGLFCHITQD